MEKRGVFTKFLAVSGTVLMWLPILVTVAASVVGTVASGMFRFDWLMPAEFFPVALIGGVLLLWAVLRAKLRRGLVGWGLGIAVVSLFGGQGLAMVTGLANASEEPQAVGWALVVVTATIAIYSLALVEIGVAGVLLTRDLFRPDASQSS
jgi:hypothetical protein